MFPSEADTYPLFETIKFEDYTFQNLFFHEKRMKTSSKKLWGEAIEMPNLYELFDTSVMDDVYRFKLSYNSEAIQLEYSPYTKRLITELIIMEHDCIEYDLKYSDRKELEAMTSGLQTHQDIIIEKNGFLTDTSFSNIALWDGEDWATPKKPLLEGTKRAYYLQEKMLVERNIKLKDLGKYSKISLINSMLDLADTIVDIQNVSLA